VAAAVLAACSSAPAAVKLPARPAPAHSAAPTSPTPSTSPSVNAQAQVTAAWDAYVHAGVAADKSRNTARAHAILATAAAPSYIREIVGRMQADWKQHEITWGQPVDHVIKVSIVTVGASQEAFVTDCMDDSGTGLANAKTGKHIAGTAGDKHAEVIGTLGYNGTRWLVSNVTPVTGGKCTA